MSHDQSSDGEQIVRLPMPLRGIVPPLATPLTREGALDFQGLRRLVAHVLEGGVHGLFLLGSTGETPSLTSETRAAIIDEVCKLSARRIPILVNVSDTCLADSRALAEHARKAGAAGVALCPPYYYPLDEAELIRYVLAFAGSCVLPVFIYNIPQFTHHEFSVESVARLSTVPNIVGLKNSNGSVEYTRKVRRLTAGRANFSILVGNEEILSSGIDAGAHGGICGGANMFPGLYVRLYEAAVRGQSAETERLQDLVRGISDAVYRVGPKGSAYLRGLKCALSRLGLSTDTMAEPLERFNAAEKAEFEERWNRVIALVSEAAEVS